MPFTHKMNYISTEFQIQYLSYYKLYVRSGYQNDVLVVVDDEEKIQALIQYPSQEPTTEATKLLALPFTDVVVQLPHFGLTFVPNEVYQPGGHELYLAYLIHQNDLPVQHVNLDYFGISGVFQYDRLLWNRWNRLFPEAVFTPQFLTLFGQLQDTVSISNNRLKIHVEEQEATFILIADGAFRFYNTFRVHTTEDLGYYVLKVLHNASLNAIDEILFSGIEDQHPYMAFGKQFAERVVLISDTAYRDDMDAEIGPDLIGFLRHIACVS